MNEPVQRGVAPQAKSKHGVVAVALQEGRLLVIRRSQLVAAPGAFCFPGGRVEAGETEQQAIVREFQEELGASFQPVRRIWSSVTSWGVRLSWWWGHVAADAVLTPEPAEVESFHWLSPDELGLRTGLLESNRHFLAALANGVFRLCDEGSHFACIEPVETNRPKRR